MKSFHKITNTVFDVSTIKVLKKKRLFCLLDRDTEWNLYVYDRTVEHGRLRPLSRHGADRCVVNFRMTEQDCDKHISLIHSKQTNVDVYNSDKIKKIASEKLAYSKICSESCTRSRQSIEKALTRR
jgi:hypothetical protein